MSRNVTYTPIISAQNLQEILQNNPLLKKSKRGVDYIVNRFDIYCLNTGVISG